LSHSFLTFLILVELSKIKRLLRGDVNAGTATLEALRRARVRLGQRSEYTKLAKLNRQPARLTSEFIKLSAADLLAHFRTRKSPRFFAGFQELETTAAMQQQLFPDETARLFREAEEIVEQHRWKLLGFGEKCFGFPEVEWNRDPLSGIVWPSDYHARINLFRDDGSDARVLWELNRLSHLITLGRAYALTKDEKFSVEFVRQIASWRQQNPVARGVNWNCAMEVALRAINLLGAFSLFLRSPRMTEEMLMQLLTMLDQHGAHIRRNLEFSHIATSNHYLCDVAGLLWLGTMLPELEAARDWREFGLRELLNEMDKQILPDGADYESSTGYHRLALELFLYSFVLCHLNGLKIDERYWNKLRAMLDYVRTYLRPDGFAPLIGDSDSGRVMPIADRRADDHANLLALGAAIFRAPRFKLRHVGVAEELLWILGEPGSRDYQMIPETDGAKSAGFADAGIYILREDDLYLSFNASDSGINGHGSHGHNDALSIEVSACGRAFIVDPGSYVYTANLRERQLFRSTAYHSTLQIDGAEQNSIDEAMPFVIGNEAQPRVLSWQTSDEADVTDAEHYGYQRLAHSVTHRRTVRFDKKARYWLIEDSLFGEGTHDFCFRFHCAPNLDVSVTPEGILRLCDKITQARVFIASLLNRAVPEFEPGFVSHDYGAKQASTIACWSERTTVPLFRSWAIIPLRPNEDDASGIERLERLRAEN
jgi:Heparinase II/III N-terminus/Heparinase II/III-like protein